MKTSEKPESQARPAARRPDRPVRKPVDKSGKKWWGVLHGDVFELLESAERPELTVQPGERMKRILFSTFDKDKADKLAAVWTKNAKGVVGKGAPY